MSATTAPVTVSLFTSQEGNEFGQKTQTLRGTFSVAASPDVYPTGGLPVSFVGVEPLKTLANPFQVIVWSAAGSGYIYGFNTATQTLQIFCLGAVSGAPLSELPAQAVPAAISGDTIQFEATFGKFDFFKS